MTAFIQELRGVFSRHIERATSADLIAIASTLCAADGSDGVSAKTAFPQFKVDGDLVTDSKTGLMWTRGNVRADPLNWSAAKEACASLKAGGYSDWRLPTIQELLSIVDYDRHNPSIDPVFSCESAGYWTSKTANRSPDVYAWIVSFSNGGSYWSSQSGVCFVRAVRAGQLIRNWD